MSTLFISHPCFLDHLTPIGHPERPDRLRAIDRVLEHERFQSLERDVAPMGTVEDIVRAHPGAYVDRLYKSAPEEGLVRIDADTKAGLERAGTWVPLGLVDSASGETAQ